MNNGRGIAINGNAGDLPSVLQAHGYSHHADAYAETAAPSYQKEQP